MLYRIAERDGALEAELLYRETSEETRSFLDLVAETAARLADPRVLISVRCSQPIFGIEGSGLLDPLVRIATASGHRIALVGDSRELATSHEYLALLAKLRGVRIRSFAEEGAALCWLTGERGGSSAVGRKTSHDAAWRRS